MALAALIFSATACLIALASATFTFQQARAEREATAIERDRRHDETAPIFSAECEDVNGDGGFYRLWITLESDAAIDGLAVDLPPKAALRFTTGILGVAPDSDGLHAESYEGAIAPGSRVCWRFELLDPDKAGVQATAAVKAFRGTKKWNRRIKFELPYDISSTVL